MSINTINNIFITFGTQIYAKIHTDSFIHTRMNMIKQINNNLIKIGLNPSSSSSSSS